jgi:hypothetical protein
LLRWWWRDRVNLPTKGTPDQRAVNRVVAWYRAKRALDKRSFELVGPTADACSDRRSGATWGYYALDATRPEKPGDRVMLCDRHTEDDAGSRKHCRNCTVQAGTHGHIA